MSQTMTSGFNKVNDYSTEYTNFMNKTAPDGFAGFDKFAGQAQIPQKPNNVNSTKDSELDNNNGYIWDLEDWRSEKESTLQTRYV